MGRARVGQELSKSVDSEGTIWACGKKNTLERACELSSRNTSHVFNLSGRLGTQGLRQNRSGASAMVTFCASWGPKRSNRFYICDRCQRETR